MSAPYFESKVPEPFRVLGLTLLPLSLGHYGLLKRFECAFVAEEEAKATGADLILGVLICSMPVDEFIEFANSAAFAREVRKWSRRISPRPWVALVPGLRKWWRKHYGFDLFEKMRLFKEYIEKGSVVPWFWDETSDGRVSGAHWAHSMEVILRSELTWSRGEINSEPLSKALADYFKFAENKGLVRLMTDYEIELIKAAEKRGSPESGVQSPEPAKAGTPSGEGMENGS